VDANDLSVKLTAIASVQRLKILASLAHERLHVSELARRVGMSRALLYMHLTKLEEAGYVIGNLELSDDGKALKFFEVAPFELSIDIDTVTAAVARLEN
jgi:DNA-binding transcriptional ArsR family regulator